jgi:molybdopterin-guanine dinucleotide biosynthesis protein B
MISPVFGVTGWKNSGKTRMVASLISEFTRRGLRVSAIKHAHHSFDIDHEGTDSFQHRRAGAREVALVSRNRWAIMHELENESEPPLADILAKLAPCDLVLIEGFKREGHAKIEMIRLGSTRDEPLWPDDPSIIAIGSDSTPARCPLPVFTPANVAAIADFITAHLGLAHSHAAQ